MEAVVTKWDLVAMTIVSPRPPVATTPHVFTTPVVRELPPMPRPGLFSATW